MSAPPTPPARYTDLQLYQRLLLQARPYWFHIGGLLALGLLSAPLALLTPLPLQIAVDCVIGSHPLPRALHWVVPEAARQSDAAGLLLALGLMVSLSLLMHLQGLANGVLQTYTGEQLLLSFRAQLFRHVQRLSLLYHDLKGTTDSTYRIQHDAYAIQHIAISGVIPFITATATFTGMMYVTWRIDWRLAAVALAASPILFLLARESRRRLRTQWREVKALQSSAMSVVQEALSSARVVKAFGREEHEQKRFLRHSGKGAGRQVRLALLEGGFDLCVGLTVAIGTAAALFVGVRHVQAGLLSLGQLLIVMAYLAKLYGPLATMSKKVGDVQSALASAERAFALLDQPPDVDDRPHARRLARAAGAVEFRRVWFAYTDAQPVLRDLSFAVAPGTSLGIAGTTGAGKTTLVSLLCRFYDPTGGQVLLDGVDLRDYRLADLRNQLAIVLQEPVLFSTSIAENIAYARPGATEREIIAAAEAANAHEFIRRLPSGYETKVGERGMRLSGGERQRIALARAFLKDAPILVLDEPTSSVDLRTERAIVEAIERLVRGRTTFIIAHRLSTLKPCDRVLQIDGGQALETTPAALAVAS